MASSQLLLPTSFRLNILAVKIGDPTLADTILDRLAGLRGIDNLVNNVVIRYKYTSHTSELDDGFLDGFCWSQPAFYAEKNQ